jgi:hypothetical protein
MDDLRGMVEALTERQRKAPLTLGQFGSFLVALSERFEALGAQAGEAKTAEPARVKPKLRRVATVGDEGTSE